MDYQNILEEHIDFYGNYIVGWFDLKINEDFLCEGFKLVFYNTHEPDDNLIEETILNQEWEDFVESKGYYMGYLMFKPEGDGYHESRYLELVAAQLQLTEPCHICKGVFQYKKECLSCNLTSKMPKKESSSIFSLFK